MIGKPKFKLGSVVYHRADGSKGVVFGYYVTMDDLAYRVSWGPNEVDTCFACELTTTKPIDGVETEDEDSEK